LGSRNKTGASLRFHGVQRLNISDSKWNESAPIDLHLTNGEPITVIKDVVMKNTGQIRANKNEYKTENVVYESNSS
jgi:poly(beta-D-mannuronate) lyase